MTNTLSEINTWHQRARPIPNPSAFGVQLGCHLEEMAEMLDTLLGNNTRSDDVLCNAFDAVTKMADLLKAGEIHMDISPDGREDFLDSLADQVVTAVGVGHCAGMDVVKACHEVNASNWSKFDEQGQPIFNEHGKIIKGPNYVKPMLEGMF